VLDNDLAAKKSIPKWEERARIGMYLGPLPQHARSVGLVLNLMTGHVPPPFHCKYDPKFEAVIGNLPPSDWQRLSKFVDGHGKPVTKT
jgi:hypothetical protein